LPLAKESDTQEKLEILAKDPLGYKVMEEIVCGNMCRRSENSVLRKHGYEGLSDISWKEIYVEIEQKCPTTMKFLITLVDGMDTEGKKMAPVSLLYSITMFLRFRELSRFQRLNTIMLTDGGGGTSKMVSLLHIFARVTIFTVTMPCFYSTRMVVP